MKQDKLLIMGLSIGSAEALEYAKSIGIYTIITDYCSPDENRLKLLADEYWMIDVADIDSLEKMCRKKKVTGIFAGASEFCLDKAKELCKRLDLFFYASEEGWAAARDKRRFKECCKLCDLDTPKEYVIDLAEGLKEVPKFSWPVVMKPVDSSAQQGLFICKNEEELWNSYEPALKASAKKELVFEEYVEGNEIAAVYGFEDGKAVLLEVVEYICETINGRKNFTFAKQFSRFTKEYIHIADEKVKSLFKKLNCQSGVAFVQAIRKDGKYFFLEMGYRLNGGGSWITDEIITGQNIVKYLVDCALYNGLIN